MTVDTEALLARVKRTPAAASDLAEAFEASPRAVQAALRRAQAAGAALREYQGVWCFDYVPHRNEQPAELVADRHGVLTFGAIGDTHLCSKYARLDCLNDYYDEAERRGIRTVLHGGNWIDGEAPFNKQDLIVHGMDAQIRYLADNHPRRKGVETWAITGADHEGWYGRREGVDIGRYAANAMHEAGRTDWRDMGFMETFIRLKHPATGASSMLCLMHAGGGSAYAISYAPQKIVEGFDGGDKPAVLLIGHYHKASYQMTRNVHVVQVGCFEDQTVFMRQKKLSAHLGGFFVSVKLDPRSGAVAECTTSFRNYFVRGFYAGRWSQHGPAAQPKMASASGAIDSKCARVVSSKDTRKGKR